MEYFMTSLLVIWGIYSSINLIRLSPEKISKPLQPGIVHSTIFAGKKIIVQRSKRPSQKQVSQII